ncbi:MAG: UMP kinase [Thermoplasmata archaeon]|nr:UMP kinase [Thermoplasmata archaeon]
MARLPAAPQGHVVLSVGGSVLTTGKGDEEYYVALADLLRTVGERVSLVVTTGGGRTARDYIQLGRKLGMTEIELDEVGIEVTRLHARLLAARLGPPTPAIPPTTIAQAVHEAHRSPIVVLGGTEPGHTTDGVAALLAARLRARRVVNATRVDGLYDRDPRKHRSARRIDAIDWAKFRAIVWAGTDGSAGQEFVFDRLGADTLAAAGIPLSIVDGRDLTNLAAALDGRPFTGTQVG